MPWRGLLAATLVAMGVGAGCARDMLAPAGNTTINDGSGDLRPPVDDGGIRTDGDAGQDASGDLRSPVDREHDTPSDTPSVPDTYALPGCSTDGFDGVGAAGLDFASSSRLRAALERLSKSWDNASVMAANEVLGGSGYDADDLAAFFGAYFAPGGHRLTEDLLIYIFYPSFGWLDEAARDRLQHALALPLMSHAAAALAAHPADLGPAMLADPGMHESLMNVHRFLDDIVNRTGDGCLRRAIYDRYRSQTLGHPAYFGAAAIDNAAQPGVAMLRAQMRMSFRDSLPLTPEVKRDLGAVLGLSGRYLAIWERFSTLIHDNYGFSDAQLAAIEALLAAIPDNLLELGNITQGDLLGHTGTWIHRLRKRTGVNLFDVEPGAVSENSFPPDVAPRSIDQFLAAFAHEANHVVDYLATERSAAYAARRGLLLAQAGADDLQYLRSQFGAAVFQNAPQEFIASIANDWFTDSAHTLGLGLARFDRGRREPLNQALFFAEIYSRGGATTRFYRIGVDAVVRTEEVPVRRNASGRIVSLDQGGRRYDFTLDASGNVVSYAVH